LLFTSTTTIGFAGLLQSVEQRDLPALKLERGGAERLTDETQVVPDHGDDHVRRLRGGNRRRYARKIVVDDRAAALIANRAAGRGHGADSIEHGGRLLAWLLSGFRRVLRRTQAPVAQLLEIVVGVGADHGDRFDLGRVQREHAVVLEKNEALPRCGEIDGPMVRPRGFEGGAREVGPARILEQAHAELQREQAPHRRVDLGFGEAAAVDGFKSALIELRGGHDDVVAGAQRHDRGIGISPGDLLLDDQPADVVPVGHHHATKTPLVLEDVREQPAIDRGRLPLDGLVTGHEGHRASAHGAFERREKETAQPAAGDVGLGRVAAALRFRVAGEVLGGGEHRGRIAEAFALIAADERGAQFADEVGVFAERLADPSPAQIASQAKHRREGPVDARRRHLLGSHAPHLLDQLGIPTCGERELSGKNGRALPERVPVDTVLSNQQRDPEALLRREVHRTVDLRAEDVEDRPRMAGIDEREVFAARVPQHQLADLLLERHAAEQIGDALVHAQSGIAIRRRGSGGLSRRPKRGQQNGQDRGVSS
jgi:hypothetical protein